MSSGLTEYFSVSATAADRAANLSPLGLRDVVFALKVAGVNQQKAVEVWMRPAVFALGDFGGADEALGRPACPLDHPLPSDVHVPKRSPQVGHVRVADGERQEQPLSLRLSCGQCWQSFIEPGHISHASPPLAHWAMSNLAEHRLVELDAKLSRLHVQRLLEMEKTGTALHPLAKPFELGIGGTVVERYNGLRVASMLIPFRVSLRHLR